MKLFNKRYTEKELIAFGNYLLSKERHNRIKYHDGKVQPNYHEIKKEVHHADVANFKSNQRFEKSIDGIIIVKPKLFKRIFGFYFILFGLILIGCNRPSKNIETITYKSCSGYFGEGYPKGWCRYGTSFDNNFEDSCHFYSYGDTIN